MVSRHAAVSSEGFIGAAFPHRFSREGDPHVHVHFLVANMTYSGDAAQGVEDAWRTLDARDLYQHRMAAGYVFQAELRERLTRELGVEWSEVNKGAAEIVSVPRPLSLALSKRRAQILDALDRDGRSSPREAEIAALTTRKGKESFDLAEQRGQWRAVAEEHGFGPDELAGTLDRGQFRDLDRVEISETVGELIGSDGLTRERSTFQRREVVQNLAAAHGRGGSVERIEEIADRLIGSDQVVVVDGNQPGAARLRGQSAGTPKEPVLTTPDMLSVEAAMVDQAVGRVGEGTGVVRLADGDDGFARRAGGLVLSDEQQQLVRQLVTSGHGVEVARARAGTGKTTAIDAARELWERAEYNVVGAALAGRAADELRARGGIESYTVHGLLQDLDRGGEWGLGSRSVLVVDEAGMVDSRRMARLLDHAAQANAKVVLIGDERQLAAVEAGGGFAALADRLDTIELTEVYRQQHAWDRQALDQLRHGDVSEWVAAYEQHGRPVPCQGADDQLQAVVADWYFAAGEHGLIETQIFAATRDDADALNHLARAARVATGELDDTNTLVVSGRVFAEGDRVLALRNEWVRHADRPGKHQLRNGNRATVMGIDRDNGDLRVRLDTGPEVVLANDYLRDGRLSHGYAQTIHKSQGMTITQDFVLASPDLARELGYVASSRHTDTSRFYINVGQDTDLDRPQIPGLEDEPLYAQFERALGVERAKQLAVDATEIDADLGELTTAQLIELRDRGEAILSTIPTHARRARDAELLERAAANAAHLDGLLTTARNQLAELGGRRDHQRRSTLEQRIDQFEQALETARVEVADRTDTAAAVDPTQVIEQHEMEIVDAAVAEQELAARRANAHWRATRTAALDADPAIERQIGERPEAPTDRERWEQVAAAQESYRLQYGALPQDHDPTNLTGRQAADWNHTQQLAELLFDPPGVDPTRDLAPGQDISW